MKRLLLALFLVPALFGGTITGSHPRIWLQQDIGGGTTRLQRYQAEVAAGGSAAANWVAFKAAVDAFVPATCVMSDQNAQDQMSNMALAFQVYGTASYGTCAAKLAAQVAVSTSLNTFGSAKSCTDATNTTPIVVTCTAHGFVNGQIVFGQSFVGNTAPNLHLWMVANKTADTFELAGSTGNGAYSSGGTMKLYSYAGYDNSWRGAIGVNYPTTLDWAYSSFSAAQLRDFENLIIAWASCSSGVAGTGNTCSGSSQLGAIGCCQADGNYWSGKIRGNAMAWIALGSDFANSQAYYDNTTSLLTTYVVPAFTTGLANLGATEEGPEYMPQGIAGYLDAFLATLTGSGDNYYSSIPNFSSAFALYTFRATSPTNAGVLSKYEPFPFADIQVSNMDLFNTSYANAMLKAYDRLIVTPDATNAAYVGYWLTNIRPIVAGDGMTTSLALWSATTTAPANVDYRNVLSTYYTTATVNDNTNGAGTVLDRSDWTSTGVWVGVRCGLTYGANHAHADETSFQVYYKTGWLTREDMGHVDDNNMAPLGPPVHNVLAVNGHGGICQGSGVDNTCRATNAGVGGVGSTYKGGVLTQQGTSSTHFTVTCDATNAYKTGQTASQDVSQYLRNVFFLKPGVIVTTDWWGSGASAVYKGAQYNLNVPYGATSSSSGVRTTISQGTARLMADVIMPTTLAYPLVSVSNKDAMIRDASRAATAQINTEYSIPGGGTSQTFSGLTGDWGTAVNGARTVTSIATTFDYNRFQINADTSSTAAAFLAANQKGLGLWKTNAYTLFRNTRVLWEAPSSPQTGTYQASLAACDSTDTWTAPTNLGGTNVNAIEIGGTCIGHVYADVVVSPLTQPITLPFTYSGFSTTLTRTHHVPGVVASTAYHVDTSTPGTVVISTATGSGDITADSGGVLEYTTTGTGGLDHFTVSCPTNPVVAGVSQNCTVTAKDASNNTVTSYTGSPTCSSNDPLAVIGSCASFVAGVKTVSLVLKTAGTSAYFLNVTDSGASGNSGNITVNAAAAASCTLSGLPSPVGSGVSNNATMACFDAFSNPSTCTGNNTASSNDAGATLPGVFAFNAGETSRSLPWILLAVGSGKSITETNAGGSFACSQTGITVTGVSGFLKAK